MSRSAENSQHRPHANENQLDIWLKYSVQVVKVLSIIFLIEENNEIKRIYGIDLHDLHISPACAL